MTRGVGHLGEARERSFQKSNEPGTIKNLRKYQPGEDAKAIHWKATARQSKILLKEYEHGEEQQVVVYLGNTLPVPQSEANLEAFEKAVSLTASLVHFFVMSGFRVGLKTGTEEIPIGRGLAHLSNMLQILALIAPTDRTNPDSQSPIPPYPKILILPVPDPSWDRMRGRFSQVLEISDPEIASWFASSVTQERKR